MESIYLDYNASTPIDPQVFQAMEPWLRYEFGNPSSWHSRGSQARGAVEKARGQVASLLGCHRDEVLFTSGGTESNNQALKGIAYSLQHKGRHIITQKTEHPAILEVCHFLARQGFSISQLEVDESGLVNVESLEKAIRPDTILVSIMHANNETGSIQPIAGMAQLARAKGVLFHTDAAQSVGKVPVNVSQLGVDMLSLAGHKMYAPKGVGALFIRRGLKLPPLLHGAGQEQGRRAGTENVSQICGLGMAAELICQQLDYYMLRMHLARERLWEGLREQIPGDLIRLNGHPVHRLPNTLSLSFRHTRAQALLSALPGLAASAGAACHSEQVEVSSVLEAMKVPPEFAMGTLRFSTGRDSLPEEMDRAAHDIAGAFHALSGHFDWLKPAKGGRLKPSVIFHASEKAPGGQTENAGETVSEPSDNTVLRLTQFTHGLGCACKMQPQQLEQLLKTLPPVRDPRVLVGLGGSDDAAAYQITDEIALVQTLDFFTPIVDDPHDFGAIAAANALSDIYAMGARPLFALNIVGFPTARLSLDVLSSILAGASEKAAEAGIFVLGGHTIEDTEPKFGMVVSGWVHPDKLIRNSGARSGDVLLLTKSLGTGIISTAAKRGLASVASVSAARESMLALNDKAARLMEEFPVHACTDISGFGLLGHLHEMLESSNVAARVYADKPGLLEGAEELALAGAVPGGSFNNLAYAKPFTEWADEIPEHLRLLMCDAQTSGGLLIALDRRHAPDFISCLNREYGQQARIIGFIESRQHKYHQISVRYS